MTMNKNNDNDHYHFKVTILEKSSRSDGFSAHTVTFLKIVSQKCTRLHLSGPLLGSSWPLPTRDFSPKR